MKRRKAYGWRLATQFLPIWKMNFGGTRDEPSATSAVTTRLRGHAA
jgi:hypothetical protein